MKATIDGAGRLVIPKALRDLLGLRQGEVEVEADGADLRVRPVAEDSLDEQDGWLLVPASGAPVTDEDVRALRDADQR
jgi:AbrB family looped-hinge helix DNA binding protein